MQYYLTLTAGTRGAGVTPDGTFPAAAVECTQAQYAAADAWTVNTGSVVAYTPPPPTAAETSTALYAAALAAGLVVTSTSTPSLNGTYGLQTVDTDNIMAEAQFIGAFSEFTNTTTNALPYLQQNSFTPVTFISTTQYMAFAKAAGQYVAAIKLVAAAVAAGGSPTWPVNTATIP